MRIIDRLLIKSFIPPFIVTFFIAIFVLIMQFLWKWIDEIAGKGVGFFFILEMLGYMSISLIPLALPIAVLISSVMVMGNMSERYELSSFKSAGVSLARVMLPLMFLTSVISLFSFICSDKLIPISNLKYQSRLYDVKNQKPTLSLEEGVFNDDFQGFSIRIGNKKTDNKTIENVLMYDQSNVSNGRFAQVSARKGEMFVTADEQFFIMKLYDGVQYVEPRQEVRNGERNYPFIRTSFEEWTKVFDLTEFSLDRTDETLFKSHHNMLSSQKLKAAIDSIDNKRLKRIERMKDELNNSLHLRKSKEEQPTENTPVDTVLSTSLLNGGESISASNTNGSPKDTNEFEVSNRFSINTDSRKRLKKYNLYKFKDSLKATNEYKSLLGLFVENDQRKAVNKAISLINGAHQNVISTERSIRRTKENRIKHIYQLHNKFSTAVACLIFLFVGAPMGAIIRKGGFGYPLLISVIFFVTYIVLTILFKKMTDSEAIIPALGAWMPCVIILPIGIFLTHKAMNDAKLIQLDWLINLFTRLGRFLSPLFKFVTKATGA